MADNVDFAGERARGAGQERRPPAEGLRDDPGGALRRRGRAPPLAVETRTLDYTLTHFGDNALYDIDLGSGSSTARVVDAHRDPVSGPAGPRGLRAR